MTTLQPAPAPLALRPADIPTSLRAAERWLTWKPVPDPKRPDKPKKMPLQARTGGAASSTDPATWAPFDLALSAYQRRQHAGLGFALGDGWAGVDFDGCRDPETGAIAAWAAPWLALLASYTEVSPSGSGVKVIARAEVVKPLKLALGDHIGVEVYGAGRYFTITGHRLDAAPGEPQPAQEAIDALIAHYRPPAPVVAPAASAVPAAAPSAPPASLPAEGWRRVRAAAVDLELRQWAQRKCTQAAEHISTQPGNFHNARFAMARLLGGVMAAAPRHLSEQEALSVLYQARIPESHQGAELKAIIDGLRAGQAAPLAPEDGPRLPTDEDPRQDAQGRACCPACGERLAKSKYDYPSAGPGWYCPRCKHPMIWPAEAVGGAAPAGLADPGTPADVAALGPTASLAAALEAAGHYCALNVETSEITINGEPYDDVTRALLRGEVRDKRLGAVGILDDAITLQAHQHRHAPIRDGLAALEWDGGAHIAQVGMRLGTAAGAVIRYADGRTRRAAEVFLERWLLGAVGRVFDGEQNAMLVLDGPQNIGKSSLVKWIGGVLPGVFCEETPNPQDKDSLLRLTKTLVWEAGELDATTRKHDVSALKHFLTRSTVTARRAYARFDTTKAVRASFIGTVNSAGNGFLSDPTGNRRFLVLSLTGIDWSYQGLDVRQLWAEAVARYAAGERGQLAPEEAAYRDQVNREEHQSTGLMDDWLAMYFEVTRDASDLMTSGEIAAHLAEKDIHLGGNDTAQAMAIAAALTRAGIARADRRAAQRHYGRFQRAWVGIAVRGAGRRGGDPPSYAEPPLNHPAVEAGSAPQNALDASPIQPNQPHEEKNTYPPPPAPTPLPAPTPPTRNVGKSAGSGGSPDQGRLLPRPDGLIHPQRQGGSHSAEGGSPVEGGSAQMPAGWRLLRCDCQGQPISSGGKWLAEALADGERTEPCDHPAEAVFWARRLIAQHQAAA